jgi:UDP-N-acetylglucosamine 2-epimerase (non-hydrolysing)
MEDDPYFTIGRRYMEKICIVGGARPNFMKIAPIIHALEKREDRFEYRLVHTGQHYDRDMSDVFFNELEIPKPHYYLDAGGGSHAEQTAKIMVEFEKVCHRDKPDWVVVVGDVNSTLACSIVAKKEHIRVAHVEAGLRSGDWAMPEEVNRVVTDSISDLFFVTERAGQENLINEGHSEERVSFVGHVMIDNLLVQVEKLNRIKPKGLQSTAIKNNYSEYAALTLHRPSNVDNKKNLQSIIGAISEVSKKIPVIFPIHPRTQSKLNKFGISLNDRIVQTSPLPYLDFLNLWKDAKMVLTDSGGIQEETTALGIPCLTLRDNTERPITIEFGTNILVGTSPERIILEANRILEGKLKTGKIPPLWDGKAAERIVDHFVQMKYDEFFKRL